MGPFIKKSGFIFIIFFSIFSCVYAWALEIEVEGANSGIRQGDVAFIKVKSSKVIDNLSADFEGKKILLESSNGKIFTGLLGIGMYFKPGSYDLIFSGNINDETILKNVPFNIDDRDYQVEKLSLPKKMVTPDRTLLKRINREDRALGNVKKNLTEKRFWEGEFLAPVDGSFSDNFGARRILNGVNKKPHSGVDIKAYRGTNIVSPNSGKVIYVDNMYYGGKTVIIDHGQGLSTLYMHLSKILVNHGEEIEKGELIGLVGTTGRSTGPHLHWGAYMHGEKVDPSSLLRLPTESIKKESVFASDEVSEPGRDQLGGS